MSGSMGLPVTELAPYTFRLWCNYLLVPLVLWSPLLFTNKRRWTYVLSLLVDFWFIGNLIYFRSYGDVLSRWCMSSAENMNGLWSSILPFMRWSDCAFLLITILWIVLSERVEMRHLLTKTWQRVCVVLGILFVANVPQAITAHKTETPICPFATFYDDVSMGRVWYSYTYGSLMHFCNESINYLRQHESEPQPVSDTEIAPFLQKPDSLCTANGNVLFVLFESLEDWTIGLRVGDTEVTPNMNHLVANPNCGHYQMLAPVKHGKSSDARLTAFNGLLPIYNGATSMRYAGNTYPSWVKYASAPTKQMFTASNIIIWNSKMNALAYGFDSIYAEPISDGKLIEGVLHSLQTAPKPFIITVCTMASHAPFIEYADSSWLPVGDEYSTDKARYLKCVHYSDSVLGQLIDTILIDPNLAKTTRIVITGDHSIFELNAPVPFIIYDPFTPPVSVNRMLYQLDIHTTMVERMNISTPWRGLGRNIADTCAYTADEIKALETLSDRLIRTDYFAKGIE